jgi:hypothetical protein
MLTAQHRVSGRKKNASWTSICCRVDTNHTIYFLFYWVGTQGLLLARQDPYHLGYAPSHFCFSYFSGSLLRLCPSQLWTSILNLCGSTKLESQMHTTMLNYLVEMGLANFLSRLVLNHDPSGLCLPNIRITGVSHWL